MPIQIKTGDRDIHFNKNDDSIRNGVYSISSDNYKRLKHQRWAPTWDPKQEYAFKNPPPFKHIDRGHFGDPTFQSILGDEALSVKLLSPKLGLEIDGLQLSSLSASQKDDLALLVEQKGVVVFRNQDFRDKSFENIKDWGRSFGPLHVHPTSGSPYGQPEFHITFRRGSEDEHKISFANTLNNINWHSDVSYELQPPGITLFAMLQTDIGGDTQFLDTITAYERLSPQFQKMIEGLKVVNSSKDQAFGAAQTGGIQRKIPIESIHPLVRYHPVLKKKCLYINRNFSRRILGLKQEESDNLLSFLINHVETCLDAHVRASWDEKTVVVWDNRRLLHTATLDWESESLRHAFRLTTLAERPIGSEEEFKSWSPEKEEKEIAELNRIFNLMPAEYYLETRIADNLKINDH